MVSVTLTLFHVAEYEDLVLGVPVEGVCVVDNVPEQLAVLGIKFPRIRNIGSPVFENPACRKLVQAAPVRYVKYYPYIEGFRELVVVEIEFPSIPYTGGLVAEKTSSSTATCSGVAQYTMSNNPWAGLNQEEHAPGIEVGQYRRKPL
jgi:hypothetical protein